MTPISATQQFKAIATLRLRLFVNSFRRKGGVGEVAARLIAFPLAFVVLFGIMSGSFAAGLGAAENGHLEYLAGIFWGVLALQVVVSINIAAPGLSFDPAALIRFPLSFPRYLLVRLFLGLLSASTVVGTCALLACAAGVAFILPRLAPMAVAVALTLALTTMLFTRMVFAWVDRWLSTRRAREFFTGFIILFSIAAQYANVTFNGLGRHQTDEQQQARIDTVLRVYHSVQPALHALPPGLAGLAIVHAGAGQTGAALLLLGVVLLFALLFLAVFAWRMQREYRGENLSEVARQPVAEHVSRTPQLPATTPVLTELSSSPAPNRDGFFSPAVSAMLTKEWTYIRRNPAQYYGLLAPLAMVFLFAARMSRFGASGMIFPAGAAYSILGVSALAYNVLGLDANGVQFYFLSPVSFHRILLVKNLFYFLLPAVQLFLLYVLITFTSGAPGLEQTFAVLSWAAFATLVNVTVGNARSITSPKKIDPAKVSRRQASQLSALVALMLMLAVIGLGALVLFGARYVHLEWLPIPIFGVLAVVAFAVYWTMLGRVDTLAERHRETLIEELSKVE